jgi:hypothetical protein
VGPVDFVVVDILEEVDLNEVEVVVKFDIHEMVVDLIVAENFEFEVLEMEVDLDLNEFVVEVKIVDLEFDLVHM